MDNTEMFSFAVILIRKPPKYLVVLDPVIPIRYPGLYLSSSHQVINLMEEIHLEVNAA